MNEEELRRIEQGDSTSWPEAILIMVLGLGLMALIGFVLWLVFS